MIDRTGLTPARVTQIIKDATNSGALPPCCTPFLSPDAFQDSGPGAVIVPTYGQFVFPAAATDVSITFKVYNLNPGVTFTSVLGLAVIVSATVTQNVLPAADEVELELDVTALPSSPATDFITITNPCGCSAGIQLLKEEIQ